MRSFHVRIIAVSLTAAVWVMISLYPLGIGGDYPNHLARNYIEGWISSSVYLAQYYEVTYGLIPDLTMDLIIPWLSKIIDIYAAGALLLAIAAVSGPLAGIFLSRKIHGRGSSWLPLTGFGAVFIHGLGYGLVNFLIASGVAIAGFAFWVSCPPGWRRALWTMPIGLFLVVNHALGYLLFGFLCLLWEIASLIYGYRGTIRQFAAQMTTTNFIGFLPGLVYLVLSILLFSGHQLDTPEWWENWVESRLQVVAYSFSFTETVTSIILSFTTIILLLYVIFLGIAIGEIKIDQRMRFVCLAFALFVIALPDYVMGIWGLHLRFGPILVILIFASLRFTSATSISQPVLALVLGALIVAQFWNGAVQMREVDAQSREIRNAFQTLPKGTRLLSVADPAANRSVSSHAPSFAVIEADAYWPALFTHTSPVGVKPEWRSIHMPAGLIRPDEFLAVQTKTLPRSDNPFWSRHFYYGWPENFTHVAFIRAQETPSLETPFLCTQLETQHLILYEVTPVGSNACSNGTE